MFLGCQGIEGGSVTPMGSHKTLQGSAEGRMLMDGDRGAGDGRGELSPKRGPPTQEAGRNSLCSSPQSDATPN